MGTHVVENVDHDEDRHSQIQLSEQLSLQCLAGLSSSKFLVADCRFDDLILLDIPRAKLAVVGVKIWIGHDTGRRARGSGVRLAGGGEILG